MWPWASHCTPVSLIFLMYTRGLYHMVSKTSPKSGLIGMNNKMNYFVMLNLRYSMVCKLTVLSSVFEGK